MNDQSNCLWIIVSCALITLGDTKIRDTFLKENKYCFLLAEPNISECQQKNMWLQLFMYTQRKTQGQEWSCSPKNTDTYQEDTFLS